MKRNIFSFICLFIVLFFCVACATSKKRFKRIPSHEPRTIEQRAITETPAKKEIVRMEPRIIAPTASLKASSKIVEVGRRELAQGELDKASQTFQQAINIDPSNGIAYYYLAKVKYELSEYDAASGVLDKAEELLQGIDEWIEAVNTLREMIKSNKS